MISEFVCDDLSSNARIVTVPFNNACRSLGRGDSARRATGARVFRIDVVFHVTACRNVNKFLAAIAHRLGKLNFRAMQWAYFVGVVDVMYDFCSRKMCGQRLVTFLAWATGVCGDFNARVGFGLVQAFGRIGRFERVAKLDSQLPSSR